MASGDWSHLRMLLPFLNNGHIFIYVVTFIYSVPECGGTPMLKEEFGSEQRKVVIHCIMGLGCCSSCVIFLFFGYLFIFYLVAKIWVPTLWWQLVRGSQKKVEIILTCLSWISRRWQLFQKIHRSFRILKTEVSFSLWGSMITSSWNRETMGWSWLASASTDRRAKETGLSFVPCSLGRLWLQGLIHHPSCVWGRSPQELQQPAYILWELCLSRLMTAARGTNPL